MNNNNGQHYRVLQKIMMGFLTPGDSYDAYVDPGEIIFLKNGELFFKRPKDGGYSWSVTHHSAVPIWLEQKKIEPIFL